MTALTERVTERFADYRERLGVEVTELPDEPQVVSYLVAAAVVLDLPERQGLLEQPTTSDRLRAEIALLRRESALISAFRCAAGGGSDRGGRERELSEPEAGGGRDAGHPRARRGRRSAHAARVRARSRGAGAGAVVRHGGRARPRSGPRPVFKTLLADVDGRLVVAVVPVDRSLDLKALATAVGGKRAVMAEPAVAERATGYVVGGISPLGQRRRLPTVVDASALDRPTMLVSAGRRGLDVELAPADLVRLTAAVTAPLAR